MHLEPSLDLLSVEDFSSIIQSLNRLGADLEKMLNEYQSTDRREQIELLRYYCKPTTLLEGLKACLNWNQEGSLVHAETLNLKSFKDIQLEQEFYKCEFIDCAIKSWLGKTNPRKKGSEFFPDWRNSPHPWLNDPDLERFPSELAIIYESVMSSYFLLFDISPQLFFGHGAIGDRQLAWEFWSQRIHLKNPTSDDASRWEEMCRSYFYSANKRSEFLNNIMHALALSQGRGESEAEGSDNIENKDSYGFVYFIRNGDLYKIGVTENLKRRMSELKPDEILNIIRCRNYLDLERSLHAMFKNIRLPQSEYFRMLPNHIEETHRRFEEFLKDLI